MDRLLESRRIVREMLDKAFEVYLEEEGRKGDSWRDRSWRELYEHLKGEIEEIASADDPDEILHDCLDACALAALLAAKTVIDMGAVRHLKGRR